jgi:lipoprotein-anchoring transpeptidase ErfK/SrfK
LAIGLTLILVGGPTAALAHGTADGGHGRGAHRTPATSVHRRSLLVPRHTVLARLRHRANGYASATARQPNMTVPRRWYGSISVLPVLKQSGSRVKVRLARRPNESTTWIRKRAVHLSRTDYAILIDLSARHLFLFEDRQLQGAYPVGVGKRATPTPTGSFFFALYSPPPEANVGYGPVVLNTSAHSNVFRTFGGGNDAVIAIHGPIGEGAEIGRHGAAISHGCIRMHVRQLRKLYFLQKGTPIIITP